MGEDRHPRVVRGKGCAHVDPEDGQLNADKRCGHSGRQQDEDGRQVRADAKGQH